MEDKMKNIVVLKNLPSNIVEEAIVILKCNKKQAERIKKNIENKSSEVQDKRIDKPKDYIVKEAQMVISNYISNMENQRVVKNNKNDNKKLKKRYRTMQIATVIMFITLIMNII